MERWEYIVLSHRWSWQSKGDRHHRGLCVEQRPEVKHHHPGPKPDQLCSQLCWGSFALQQKNTLYPGQKYLWWLHVSHICPPVCLASLSQTLVSAQPVGGKWGMEQPGAGLQQGLLKPALPERRVCGSARRGARRCLVHRCYRPGLCPSFLMQSESEKPDKRQKAPSADLQATPR